MLKKRPERRAIRFQNDTLTKELNKVFWVLVYLYINPPAEGTAHIHLYSKFSIHRYKNSRVYKRAVAFYFFLAARP
jgi:hypothetical protein